MGFRISDIGLATGVKEFEEEIVIIRIAVSLASQGLDFVVNAFDFAGGDVVSGVSDDAFEVSVQQTPEPQEMRVADSQADIYNLDDFIGHACLVGQLVGCDEFLL